MEADAKVNYDGSSIGRFDWKISLQLVMMKELHTHSNTASKCTGRDGPNILFSLAVTSCVATV